MFFTVVMYCASSNICMKFFVLLYNFLCDLENETYVSNGSTWTKRLLCHYRDSWMKCPYANIPVPS